MTVSGTTPVVDTQSVRREVVLGNEVLASIPSIRGYSAMLNAIPAIQGGNLNSGVGTSNGVSAGVGGGFFNSYGSRPNEGRVNFDGLNIGGAYNGGGQGFSPDPSTAEEMQVTVAGGLGESEIGSAMVNFVPKSGGNTFRGQAFMSSAGEWSQGNNLTDELRSFGITAPGTLIKQWDLRTSLGGPIKRDKLWFFGNARTVGSHQAIPGVFGNRNFGDQSRWDYVADPNLKARDSYSTMDFLGRVTAQITPRNKVNVTYNKQLQCSGSANEENADSCRPRGSDWVANGGAVVSPESQTRYNDNFPNEILQATWSSPVTNRLLFDAGFSTFHSRWGWTKPPGGLTSFIPVTELAANTLFGFSRPTLTYRGLDNLLDDDQNQHNWRASISERDRCPQYEVWISGRPGHRRSAGLFERLAIDLHVLEWTAHLLQFPDCPMASGQPDPVVRTLRTRSVDIWPGDGARCDPVRSSMELVPGGGEWRATAFSIQSLGSR